MPIETPCARGGVRRALTLIAASCLFGCPVMPQSCGKEAAPAPRAAALTKAAPPAPAETLPLDPFQRRAALDAAYRLKPDHRILLAVEAVQRFFVAGIPGSATAVWENEGWRVRLGPANVGTLPDLPDFQQVLLLLDAFAKRLRDGCRAAQAAGADDRGKILLTIFLRHDQSKTLPEIRAQLERTGFMEAFPPAGVEVVSWYVMMGIGQVVTVRLPAERLREVNRIVEEKAWGAYRTDFYATYDYKAVAEQEHKKPAK